MSFAIRKPRAGGPTARLGDQRGSVIVLALLIMMVIGLLGSTLLVMATTEDQIALNEVSAETAFLAADAGIALAIRQIPNTAPIPQTTLTGSGASAITYQTIPVPLGMNLGGNMTPVFVSYSIVPFTGTNMVFQNFQVDVVGAAGSAMRQLEIQDMYGPTSADYNN